MDFSFSINLSNHKNHPSKGLDSELLYDVLIIGGGPSGLNAAIYAKRKGLSVGLIAKTLGGQVKETSSVENYLGTESLSGEALVENFVNHLKTLEVPLLDGQMVVDYNRDAETGTHQLTLEYGEIFKSKTVLLAMGSTPRRLGVPGEKELLGKGVAYCAICDGPLYKGKQVIVAGGGNAAVEAALDLSKIASKVSLVHRSQLRADQVLIDELKSKENIEVYLETQIESVIGTETATGVRTIDGNHILGEGIFIEVGYVPNLGLFKSLVHQNEKGEVQIDNHNQTSLEGVFAAGDVTDVLYKQIIVAAAEGAKAALSINEYLMRR